MKVKYNKEAHKVYSLIYHLIFVVKYRKKVFKDEIGIIEDFKRKRNKPFKKFYGFDARKLRLWIYECRCNKLSPRIQLL